MGPEGSKTEQFFRYTDASGRVHIVSSPDALPPEARAKAELVVLNPEVTRREQAIMPALTTAPKLELHGLSFGAGFASALVLALIFRMMPQDMRWAPKLAIMAVLAVGGGGLYFGYLHQMSGISPAASGSSSSPFASPTTLIDDARRTVEQVQQSRKRQEEDLEAIKREAR